MVLLSLFVNVLQFHDAYFKTEKHATGFITVLQQIICMPVMDRMVNYFWPEADCFF